MSKITNINIKQLEKIVKEVLSEQIDNPAAIRAQASSRARNRTPTKPPPPRPSGSESKFNTDECSEAAMKVASQDATMKDISNKTKFPIAYKNSKDTLIEMEAQWKSYEDLTRITGKGN